MGITEKMYRDLLNLNVDVVTMGNHTWGKKEIFGFIIERLEEIEKENAKKLVK